MFNCLTPLTRPKHQLLKTKMWAYFTANKTTRYIVLQDLLYTYNHSVHHSENENRAWRCTSC